jgi:hypothetical protein
MIKTIRIPINNIERCLEVLKGLFDFQILDSHMMNSNVVFYVLELEEKSDKDKKPTFVFTPVLEKQNLISSPFFRSQITIIGCSKNEDDLIEAIKQQFDEKMGCEVCLKEKDKKMMISFYQPLDDQKHSVVFTYNYLEISNFKTLKRNITLLDTRLDNHF